MGAFPQGGDGNSGEEGSEAGTERLVSRVERRMTPQRRLDEESWESPVLEPSQEKREFTDLPSLGPGCWDPGGLSLRLMGKTRFAVQETGRRIVQKRRRNIL